MIDMIGKHLTEAQILVAIEMFNKGHKITSVGIHTQSGEGNCIISEEVDSSAGAWTEPIWLGKLDDKDYRDTKTERYILSGYYAPDGTYLGKF